VVGGQDNYGLPGFFKAFSTSGQFLWQINLPGEPYPGIFETPFERGRFSPDGTTVYLGTTISGEPLNNLHCYLYAIQTTNTQTCSYSINPLSKSFPSTGGEDSVNVIAPNGCTWTATSNAPWLTIISATSGSGNEVVNYIVRDTTVPRTGTLTIAGQTYTVTQSGAGSSCTYSISPTIKTFGKSGGADTVSVAAGTGCSWSASSNASWIRIKSGNSATGNGVVAYTVSVNSSGLARVGTMLIAGKTFTVKQKPS
jgi:hypothetical protein